MELSVEPPKPRQQRRRPAQPRSTTREPRPLAAGTITKVTPTQRDPERISVFIDGQFAFALPDIIVATRGLKRGVELTLEQVRELAGIAEGEKATAAALTFVSYRPRSEREVRDRLRRKAYEPAAIDYAIEKMRGWRYLDDTAFAEFWVENRAEHAPRGKRALQSELRAKGVDREVVERVLDETDLDEQSAALDIARKRLRSLASYDEETQRRRLAAFLARRGYGWDVVKPTLAHLFGGDAEQE
jgi:regulatory protein